MHFGDSHIQSDRITSTIRESLQNESSNAGSGILFPYSLCGSFGPNGIESQIKGKYTYATQLKNPSSLPIGVMGYTISLEEGAILTMKFDDKFKGKTSNSITIWIHSPMDTMHIRLDSSWVLTKRSPIGLGIFSYTYESLSISKEVSITANVNTSFWGVEFNHNTGLSYQQNGLVGAQFTHLINHEDHVILQLKEIQPELLLFSYGTNEAYNPIDSAHYFKLVSQFINRVQSNLPNTAILITNAPDTRSSGKIPQSQVLVNNILRNVSSQSQTAYFDLNKAMGGWGSLYAWSKKGYVLKDLLHFNKEGANKLGQLISCAIFSATSICDPAKMNSLKAEISQALCKLPSNSLQERESNSTFEKPKPTSEKDKTSEKANTYIVKKGDTLSIIANKTGTTVKRIKSLNKIGPNDLIHPGQKLKY